LRFTAINARHKLYSQFCATYHNYWPINGREFKRHLDRFLTVIRRKYPFLAYLWIGEFQTRNAPHLHIYLNIEPTEKNRHFLAEAWNRIVDPTSEEHLWWHRDRVETKNGKTYSSLIPWNIGSGSYLCKYLDKEAQKEIPEGFRSFGRWWGTSRGLVPEPEIITPDEIEENLPQVDEETGEIHEEKPFNFLIRTVGRHHEKTHKKSWFRNTAKTSTSLNGAPVFRKTLEYLHRLWDQKQEPTPY
jgi:hypothetical protein